MSVNPDKKVCAIYDVRGIQEYVFRTNKVKEIIGASVIVGNIFTKALAEAIRQQDLSDNDYYINWDSADSEYKFGQPESSIKLEVIYTGGGNTTILFKDYNLCIQTNKIISKYILENTYSLNLAIAIVEYTGNYAEDFLNLKINLSEVKSKMPLTRPVGNFPITFQDKNTGYPISRYEKIFETYEPLSSESYYKRINSIETSEKEFDKMVSDKGNDSQLAIVHIDGNNMGKSIGAIMKDITSYDEGVTKIRAVSKNINDTFLNILNETERFLETFVASEKCGFKNKYNPDSNIYQKFMRPIINSGDDITFVCNAKIAISLCEFFLSKLSQTKICGGNHCFSACAGIAIINSHFPFYEGYKVAEECCANAKKRAKFYAKDNYTVDSYIDFQICRHINMSSDLLGCRNKNYNLPDGSKLLLRPYSVNSSNANEKYSIENFKKCWRHFTLNFPRNKAKLLRNAYSRGKYNAELEYSQMNSRNIVLPSNKTDLYYDDETAMYFDVLEMLDLYVEIEGDDNRGTDKNQTIK